MLGRTFYYSDGDGDGDGDDTSKSTVLPGLGTSFTATAELS